MKVSVFVGTSLDGFLARKDGALDWLPAGGGSGTGYDEFMASIDTIVVGRNTFEVAATFPSWPYKGKRVVVLTHRPLDLSRWTGRGVEAMKGAPADIASRLERSGAKHVYLDGGATIQSFLRAGLVDRLIVTRVPVLIGEGIPLFGPLDKDAPLRHVSTRELPGGLVQSEYAVEH